MLVLLNAIYSRFNATLAGSFPGGLHRDRAPEATPMPYVVSRVVSTRREPSYGPRSRSITQVRFSAFGVGHDATGALATALTGAFDGALLALSAGGNDSVVRLSDPTPALLRQDAGGNDVWEWSVEYAYGVAGS